MIGTVNALEQRLEDIITPIDVSIIGCVVNGPGIAENAPVCPSGVVRVIAMRCNASRMFSPLRAGGVWPAVCSVTVTGVASAWGDFPAEMFR